MNKEVEGRRGIIRVMYVALAMFLFVACDTQAKFLTIIFHLVQIV